MILDDQSAQALPRSTLALLFSPSMSSLENGVPAWNELSSSARCARTAAAKFFPARGAKTWLGCQRQEPAAEFDLDPVHTDRAPGPEPGVREPPLHDVLTAWQT
ncbi:MAG: hypothetical protein HYZ20_07575 [Burkholderiales bacterium]|nr:hypothetical protein [Burkholderiales bacterium]